MSQKKQISYTPGNNAPEKYDSAEPKSPPQSDQSKPAIRHSHKRTSISVKPSRILHYEYYPLHHSEFQPKVLANCFIHLTPN